MTVAPPPPLPAWAYFLDVDGTLIDLAPTPDGIQVDRELLRLIEDLHRLCNGAVALVSGRALADLDKRLGMPQLPMAGLHGFEWRNAAGNVRRHATAGDIRSIEQQLLPLRRRYKQLIFEDKGSTLALHYRQAPRLGGYLHRWVRNLVRLAGKDLQVQPGKRVIEIKPRGHDKGSAIGDFMAQPPFFGRTPVFIGDDQTDEHGFVMVNRMGGISIKVGRGRTHALYRLPHVAAVLDWLRQITSANESRDKEGNIAIT